ncbi:MAG: hypothetical protein CML19_08150 [Pusillimonas sp.]|nr:hypothetical protein [Parvibaculum sp.]MBC42184.1 hypothetical protein [Pusillimonas sp.]|tara:strand:+ start:109 stop:555 length:447 start_codon:yes stop_codon:yes gene_type:complete
MNERDMIMGGLPDIDKSMRESERRQLQGLRREAERKQFEGLRESERRQLLPDIDKPMRESERRQFETPNIDGTMSLSSIDPEELRRIDPDRPFIKNYDRLENLVEVAGIPLDIALQLNDAMPEDIDDFSEEYDNFINMFLEASMERAD